MEIQILTKNKILKTIKENKEKIKTFGVKNLWLFGSYVKNLQTNKSDIDFLIELDNEKNQYNRVRKISLFLEDLFEREVDIGFEKDINKFLKKEILNSKLEVEI
jgi:predicted nucleotidyltransferase